MTPYEKLYPKQFKKQIVCEAELDMFLNKVVSKIISKSGSSVCLSVAAIKYWKWQCIYEKSNFKFICQQFLSARRPRTVSFSKYPSCLFQYFIRIMKPYLINLLCLRSFLAVPQNFEKRCFGFQRHWWASLWGVGFESLFFQVPIFAALHHLFPATWVSLCSFHI